MNTSPLPPKQYIPWLVASALAPILIDMGWVYLLKQARVYNAAAYWVSLIFCLPVGLGCLWQVFRTSKERLWSGILYVPTLIFVLVLSGLALDPP